ncbi:MAG: DUF4359 domain-containing protein [Chitinophagaceae bacterium]|nr:DUF4359 domain-containing protein [Chitinophagaceae bacterium]HMW13752.1 DUF4359 domain-containing protein [Chitinophagales bacterium]HMX61318.1 DUF4359 domain-containing protein [Chitinophagales bacterium]HNB48210.1 DUF4359 domain-containing protein [Chitinophagales bacterium]HNC72427.1 DUF4359 domain-containing protein [Chitinophagales bacterium]
MKKNQLIIVIVSVVILIAILTNPNQDRHKEVIKNKLNSYMQKSMNPEGDESENEWEQVGQALGMMIGGTLVENVIDNLVSTDNYILFSTTKINWDGKSRIIGIGAFGNVYITNKLEEALDKGLLKY